MSQYSPQFRFRSLPLVARRIVIDEVLRDVGPSPFGALLLVTDDDTESTQGKEYRSAATFRGLVPARVVDGGERRPTLAINRLLVGRSATALLDDSLMHDTGVPPSMQGSAEDRLRFYVRHEMAHFLFRSRVLVTGDSLAFLTTLERHIIPLAASANVAAGVTDPHVLARLDRQDLGGVRTAAGSPVDAKAYRDTGIAVSLRAAEHGVRAPANVRHPHEELAAEAIVHALDPQRRADDYVGAYAEQVLASPVSQRELHAVVRHVRAVREAGSPEDIRAYSALLGTQIAALTPMRLHAFAADACGRVPLRGMSVAA